MRLPDCGDRRMFPTAPLKEFLAAKASRYVVAKQLGPLEGDDYYGWGERRTAYQQMGLDMFCKRRGIDRRLLYRRVLGEYVVDAICCKAGVHPSEVFPDWHSLADRVEVA